LVMMHLDFSKTNNQSTMGPAASIEYDLFEAALLDNEEFHQGLQKTTLPKRFRERMHACELEPHVPAMSTEMNVNEPDEPPPILGWNAHNEMVVL